MQATFVFSHSPFASKLAFEGLDMALAFAAFEQDVTLVFVDDGVYQLLAQQGEHIDQQNIHKRLQAAQLYDINKIYVCQKSLQQRALSQQQLATIEGLKVIDNLDSLLTQSQSIMSF